MKTPDSIHCRPGTTDAMQRLADENEALRAELSNAKVAGAIKLLTRAMQETGFSDTVVRVDLMREIIEKMEGES